jgi:hypothetical protein
LDQYGRRKHVRNNAARRNFSGNRPAQHSRYNGAELFLGEDGEEVEFVTLLRFDSMAAIEAFAGRESGRPVIYPKAEPLLKRMDEQSRHYRIAFAT